ncbi:hypothetical protein GCM10022259_27340 [Aquimarina mytili]
MIDTDDHHSIDEKNSHTTHIGAHNEDAVILPIKEENSYIFKTKHDHHDHEIAASLKDIISSDEGADFNCSGGFCMNKAHFHKKGLTIKKQLFVYFMRISC